MSLWSSGGHDAEPGVVAMDADRLLAAHRAATDFYRDQLAGATGPRRYLTDRGLGPVVNEDLPWRIGYAPPGWTSLTDHLRAAGFSTADLIAAGLSRLTRRGDVIDHFRDRVMFPLRDAPHRVVGFLGRAAPTAPAHVPKYLNSPDTVIYHKGRLLFGLAEQAERFAAGWAPALVEGPADALAVWLSYHRVRRPGLVAVATCGALLTRDQVAVISAQPGTGVHGLLVAFDGDEAGRTAADRAWRLLGAGRAVELPPGTDPGTFLTRPGGRAALRRVLERGPRPLCDEVLDHRLDQVLERHPEALSYVEGRINTVRALAPFIAGLDAADAVRLVRHVAARTGVGIDTVAACVTEVLGRRTSRPHPAAAG